MKPAHNKGVNSAMGRAAVNRGLQILFDRVEESSTVALIDRAAER